MNCSMKRRENTIPKARENIQLIWHYVVAVEEGDIMRPSTLQVTVL